jgi:demethylmenaquinone methyltransferase/2-methoxy-6-polyprenyl-1,4-benzoquinol methylase
MKNMSSQSCAPASTTVADDRVAPHPILRRYYDDEAGRKQRVNALFDASARHYDWITDVMSFGSGRWYRADALRRLGLKKGGALIDVGCGTGVIAALAQTIVGETGKVVAVDPSEGMLSEARSAGVRDTRKGVGERLPVGDGEFDALTMGYALRHVADLRCAFAEYRRVLRPGGKVLLLEITRPAGRLQHEVLKFYLKYVVPTLTRLARRSHDAQTLMQYYWDTIESCVPPERILAELANAGFSDVRRHVIYGIFSEYTAVRR